MAQTKQTGATVEEKLDALYERRGSNLKVWWDGAKWFIIAAIAIFTSAGAFTWAYKGGEGIFWVFGALNIISVLIVCIKGFKAYKKEQDEINAEIAAVIKQGNKKQSA